MFVLNIYINYTKNTVLTNILVFKLRKLNSNGVNEDKLDKSYLHK